MPSVLIKTSFSISRKSLFVCFYFLLLFVYMFLRDDYFLPWFKLSHFPLSGKHAQFLFLLKAGHSCHYWIKKNDFKPWVTYRTNIIFLRVITSNLTRLPCSVVRYRGDNEKGSSIFTRNHELFCLLEKHYSTLLTKKWTIL